MSHTGTTVYPWGGDSGAVAGTCIHVLSLSQASGAKPCSSRGKARTSSPHRPASLQSLDLRLMAWQPPAPGSCWQAGNQGAQLGEGMGRAEYWGTLCHQAAATTAASHQAIRNGWKQACVGIFAPHLWMCSPCTALQQLCAGMDPCSQLSTQPFLGERDALLLQPRSASLQGSATPAPLAGAWLWLPSHVWRNELHIWDRCSQLPHGSMAW